MVKSRTRILVSGPLIKYPWGGLTQYWLAWLAGLQRLGHEVFYLEDVEWEDACYDLPRRTMTNDPSYGIDALKAELSRFGLENHWCFIGHDRRVYGMSEGRLREVLMTADALIDLEYDTLRERTANIPLRIYVDGEPGWNQLGMQRLIDQGGVLTEYHCYFTLGLNIGTDRSTAPTLGIDWKPMMCPVLVEPSADWEDVGPGVFSTVMKWKANPEIEYQGKTYGMKDKEFAKFLALPKVIEQPMQIVVSGRGIPREELRANGWTVKDGDAVSTSVHNYRSYIRGSRGEFSVVKNAFVETNCGMFMERSGYYLLAKRPVVLQDNGWSEHLPTGRGLFAVRTLEEAAECIKRIDLDYRQHGRWACELAHEYLDATKVLKDMLTRAGMA